MPASRAASRPAAGWARRNNVPGVRHARCLAAPPGRKRRSAKADWALTVCFEDAKKVGEKCGVSGEKKPGRTGGRAGAVASGRRRRLVRRPGRGPGRRPESNANATGPPGPGERAAPATRRTRGTRARGSGGERGEHPPGRHAECGSGDVFTLFSKSFEGDLTGMLVSWRS